MPPVGAVRMVELLLDAEAERGFSAHRPPGHHATPTRAMGFCLFNNVAVAARYAIDVRGLKRVAVFDWTSTTATAPTTSSTPRPRSCSSRFNESPLYPGSGAAGDAGSDDGEGFTVNLPVPPGTGDEAYRSLADHVVAPLLGEYRPQLVLISAGYDAHREDPLADCLVTEDGFAAMAATVRRAADSVGAPLGCVLEGGYALGALGRSVAATMAALVEGGGGSDPDKVPIEPIAEEARGRLSRWWAGLG